MSKKLPLLNSDHKMYKDKLRQLQEDLDLSHTKTLHQVNRIVNLATYLTEDQKEQLLKEI